MNSSAVVYSSSNTSVATISGSIVTLVGAGGSVITASQESNENYNATTVTATLSVAKDDVLLSGLSDLIKIYGDDSFELDFDSTSNGSLSFNSSDLDVATVSGSLMIVTGVGSTVLTINQSESDNYNAVIDSIVLQVQKRPLRRY